MAPKLALLSGRELIRVLGKRGFRMLRQRGSHVQLQDNQGRIVTVPVHGNEELGKGLLRKILRDAEITPEELVRLR